MTVSGRRLMLLAITALLAAPPGQADDTDTAALIAAGKQLYREGRTAAGTPLQAAVRADVAMQGNDLACVRCHRRSGLGSSEGGVGIPPIAGPTLFMAQTASLVRDYRHGELSNITRPAYTLESLAVALRSGVNPAGRSLSPLMPRYEISDAEVAAIAAYLPTLSTSAAPGITEHELHFATIVAPDATPAQRQAMLAVMEAYFAGKNAGTRGETRRAERAPFHREWMYSAYRKWVLHEWSLSGPPAQWSEQLQRYYREQPVFAVVGGIGSGTWQPVHAFCEQQELPCLFPHLNAAPDHAERDFYSFYFSRGVQLEAAALAAHLRRSETPAIRVVQVARAGSEQLTAATALHEAMPDTITRIIDNDTRADVAYWQDLLQQTQPKILVLWLKADDLEELLAGTMPALPQALYLSSTLLPEPGALPSAPAGTSIHLLHPYQLPGRETRQARFHIWARQAGVSLQDLRLQSDAYFAVTLAGEALMHIRGNLSREYFIERIEHMTDSMIYTSSYPRLSLAPGQRYAAKGSYVWRLDEDAANAEWIVP